MKHSHSPRKRIRDLGLQIGRFPTGPLNAITDVSGVQVGHSTVIKGSGKRGTRTVARTGVTAILPNAGQVFHDRVLGGAFVLNGAGEVSGLTQIMEWGIIETPIFLTNTHAVGAVSEGAVRYLTEKHPDIGNIHDVVIPVVGECDDSWLSEITGRHVRYEHVLEAIQSASSGPVPEGNVGGGTGMITCDFKGGIGTSSRCITIDQRSFTLGVLVMSNFGVMRELRIDGRPIGRVLEPHFKEHPHRRENYGSIIAILATDAPLSPHQLNRLAKRMALGVGRCGSTAAHGSGEIMLTFSTANRIPRAEHGALYTMELLHDSAVNPLYEAAIDATEEAILNALCMGEPMIGVNGRSIPALPLEQVQQILASDPYLESF